MDQDNDGVDDAIDSCPKTAQFKMVDDTFKYAITINSRRLGKKPRAWPVLSTGCEPDEDLDGVVNSKDFCPNDSPAAISKGVAINGCPLQSDHDGTPDFRDFCPYTPKGALTDAEGCPLKNRKKGQEHVALRLKMLFR